ncbi:MAG: hypothetical protein GC180_11930 [Bacteroidetes bacterium]|nr:hypothetical protein [Bacteroidota bacterium]
MKVMVRLIRPWHLAGILAAQALTVQNLSIYPKQGQLIWFFIASAFAVTAGHIIQDIKDYESDLINEPGNLWIGKVMPIENARYLYWTLFFVSAFLALQISVEAYFLFTLVLLLQFVNAVVLKKFPILENILSSAVIVYAILIVPEIFDAPLHEYPWPAAYIGFYILFLIELVSDIRSVKGDTIQKRYSIPVLFGANVSLSILWVLILLPALLFIGGFVYFVNIFWPDLQSGNQEMIIAVCLMLGLVVLPVSYLTWAAYRSRIGKHALLRLQNELKFLLVLGMLYWGIALFSSHVFS